MKWECVDPPYLFGVYVVKQISDKNPLLFHLLTRDEAETLCAVLNGYDQRLQNVVHNTPGEYGDGE